MINAVHKHIQSNLPFLMKSKLLLAVSGGLDSMVLLAIMQQLKLNIGVAHCNFSLRGEESDADEEFVKHQANSLKITCFSKRFDTEKYANTTKKSIQVAARELRYQWFQELALQHEYDFVLTAHHLDDQVETFLINFTRGTGLEGLTGINEVNGIVVRPLLPYSREELTAYAIHNAISWREDSSNSSDKYVRNRVRHQVIPILKELNPSFLNAFKQTISHLREAENVIDNTSSFYFDKIIKNIENQLIINILELKKTPNYSFYLYQWLKKYGFKAWDDIAELVEAQSGKQIFSPTHVLLKNRTELIVARIEPSNSQTYAINTIESSVNFPLKLVLCNQSNLHTSDKNTIFVDADVLQFPLTIRKWEEGDYFYPSGMQGKKKVSKYFKDEKLSLFEKQSIWILESNSQIVWIIGHRADARFMSKNETINTIKITYNNEKSI
ncbi:MAG: tRNA(Ile)-lysidine synthase [Bacteroidota bacterium]